MPLYALEVRKVDLELIALLNAGVTPEVEKRPTYFIFDSAWNSDVPNQIVTKREFLQNYDISGRPQSPMVLRLKG